MQKHNHYFVGLFLLGLLSFSANCNSLKEFNKLYFSAWLEKDTILVSMKSTSKVSITGIFSKDILCYGNANGWIKIEATGGTGNYSYNWAHAEENTDSVGNLAGGEYFVTVTDQGGSQASTSIVLAEPELLEVEINIVNNFICKGDDNGAMEAIINGGTESYDILWKRIGTNPLTWNTAYIDNLPEGLYELYVTDANQCKANKNTSLDPISNVQVLSRNPDVFNGYTPINLNGYHIACYGGTMDSTTFIGKGDYNYELIYPNGDILNFDTRLTTVKDLPAGHYELFATDEYNCQSIDTFYLLQPQPVKVGDIEISSYNLFNISCFGRNDGFIHLNNITGGIDYKENTYIYEWENPEFDSISQNLSGIIQNKAHQDNLIAGNYYVSVKNGICELKDTFTLTEPEEIQIQSIIKSYSGDFNISCFNNSDGEISVNVKGGYVPDGSYTYSWSNGNNDSIITGLSAKIYSLTVEDDIECKTTKSYELMQPEEMDINYYLSDYEGYNIKCYNGDEGTIDLFPSGGDESTYSYLWKILNGKGISETSKSQSGLTAGSYRVIVSDGNSCIDSTTIELIEPEELTILAIEKQDVSCKGTTKGFAEVIDTGGAGSNMYTWSNGETSKRIENLNALFFTVTVSDVNDCQAVSSVQIEKTDSLDIELIPVVQYSGEVISCYGSSDGEIMAQVIYGHRPYSYLWSTGSSDSVITNLNQGRYDVTITDKLQCNGIQSIFIQQPTAIDAVIDITNATCINCGDGAISLNTFGGTAPYTFNWLGTDINNIPRYSGLEAGIYKVEIIDVNNCIKDTVFEVKQPTSAIINYWEESSITYYPNPADEKVTIKINDLKTNFINLKVINSMGSLLINKEIEILYQQNLIELETEHLSQGIYFVLIDNMRLKKPLIIK